MSLSREDLNRLAQHLKSLHVPGQPLVLTNVWDASTASTVASLPATKAIATASYAIGASLGLENENTMTLEQNLEGVTRVLAGVRLAGKLNMLPVSADLQDGYADPAAAVRKAIDLGIVGCNIEDVDHSEQPPKLRPIAESASRIEAAVHAAREAGVPDFVVNARIDVLGYDGSLEDVLVRAQRYLEAGATTAFVWGAMKRALDERDVRVLVERLNGRVAVLAQGLPVAKLRECGVSRVSVGPALLWRTLGHLRSEASAVVEGEWTM